MPVVQQIIPTQGREFWDSLDPKNKRQVLEAVKEEFDRPEPAHQLHYFSSGPSHLPLSVCGVRVSQPCFRDCQVFLLRGAFHIEGQGRVIETGCSYLVKDEVWIGLCGSTTLVVMEEGGREGHMSQIHARIAGQNTCRESSSKEMWVYIHGSASWRSGEYG
jgi:hypothetical protein